MEIKGDCSSPDSNKNKNENKNKNNNKKEYFLNFLRSISDDKNSENKNKMLVLVAQNNDIRRNMHLYIERFYPSLINNKMSLYIPTKRADIAMRFIKCHECDKKVLLEEYVRGVEENNIDEAITGFCENCEHSVWFECNYDDHDDLTIIYKNNAIIIGKYIRANIPKYAENHKIDYDNYDNYDNNNDNDNDNLISQLLSDIEIYEIEEPSRSDYLKYSNSLIKNPNISVDTGRTLKKREIAKYISDKI